jgi:hypothetical protein
LVIRRKGNKSYRKNDLDAALAKPQTKQSRAVCLISQETKTVKLPPHGQFASLTRRPSTLPTGAQVILSISDIPGVGSMPCKECCRSPGIREWCCGPPAPGGQLLSFPEAKSAFLQIRAKVSSIVNTFHKDGFKCELLNPRFIALGKNPDEARLV